MKLLPITLIAVSSILLAACLPEESVPTPPTTWYVDADSDGYGDENDSGTASTTQSAGYVSNNTDCDDGNADKNPGNSEILYDGVDNDCSGTEFGNNEGYYSVGQVGPAGGIVFFITGTGDGREGFEAAPEDVNGGAIAEWGCSGIDISGASGTAVGTGAQNTADMLAAGCSPDAGGRLLAADLANAYSLNGYSDWFLPSRDELNELYLQSAVIDGLASADYWTSSEVDSANAQFQQFWNSGGQSLGSKAYTLKVRVIRAFST